MGRLTKWKCFRTNKKLFRANSKISISDLTWKLGQHEDIEEELGIDLVTLFKALTQGVFLENGKRRVEHHAVFLCKCDGHWALGYEYSTKYGLQGWVLETKKYRKHWALTKEELLKKRNTDEHKS